jgi:hypothetical protein
MGTVSLDASLNCLFIANIVKRLLLMMLTLESGDGMIAGAYFLGYRGVRGLSI